MNETILQHHLDVYGWPEPPNHATLDVFAPDGVRACAWFIDATNPAEFTSTLHNKSEALARRFYGLVVARPGQPVEPARRQPRTSFMANGYPVLAHFVEWCRRTGQSIVMSSAAKAKAFLEERVARARDEWGRRAADGHKGNSTSPADAAYNAYRHSVCHLSALSFWQGYNIDVVTTEEIQTLRIALMQDIKRAKIGVQDSAATSALLTKRLDADETRRLFRGLWEGALDGSYKTSGGRERAQMRGLLVAALNQAAGRRGGDLRGIDLRMFLWHALEDVGPAPAWCVGVSLRTVKEDNLLEDREHLLGFMRARERWRCPVGVLAIYLEWMNQTTGFLALMKRDLSRAPKAVPAWWSLPLMPGRRAGTAISSTTHIVLTHAGFDAGEIYGKRCATHIHRPTALGNMLEGGVVSTDAALYQGWVHGVWADTYAKCSFKVVPMLKSHGWAPRIEGYECWWEGSDDDVPAALASAVFVGLDEVAAGANARWREHRDDRSMVEFCRVLKALRRVFLEDARVHREAHPDFPAYRACGLWHGPTAPKAAWAAYAAAEGARIDARRATHELRRLDAGIASALTSMVADLKAAAGVARGVATGACATGACASASTTAIASISPPPPMILPELPEPHLSDLRITYARWREGGDESVRATYRTFLAEHRRIPWAKLFPKDRANAVKMRYYKIKPFLDYMDAHEDDATRLLDAFNALMKAHKVDGPVFVKQCFYALSSATDATHWTSPIPRTALEAIMA